MTSLTDIGTVVAAFRLENGAFTPITAHLYRFNRKRTRNPVLDHTLSGIFELLESYLEKFHHNINAVVRYDEFIAEEWDRSNPFVILIYLSDSETPISKTLVEQLQTVIRQFAVQILQQGEDLVLSEGLSPLTSEQNSFIEECAENFIRKNGERNISDAFLCEFPNHHGNPIPFQGKIQPTVHVDEECLESSFYAMSDGAKGEDLLIYLKIVDEDFRVPTKKAQTFIAESFRMTQIASAAQASEFPIVKVTTTRRLDEKGKSRNYVKQIERVDETALPGYELGDTLKISS